jgi:hypothetical protein
MSDRDHWELRGPVRTADIHRSWRYHKCNSGESSACELTENGDHSIVEFRLDGAISRHWHRNPDGSEITETHAYDPAGLLITVQFETSSGASFLQIYEYDSLGRLTRHLSHGSDGNERVLETYSYDTQGRKTKTHFAPQHTNYHYAVEGSKSFYSVPNATTNITNYNHADRPVELTFNDANGTLLSRVDFTYDESGNLTEEKQTMMVSPFPSLEEQLPPEQLAAVRDLLSGPTTRHLHSYDALGHRIETLRSLFGSLGSERVVMEYNGHGDLITQISDDKSREYGFDDQGQLVDRPGHQSHSETRFLYEYDSRGNWTSKIAEVRHDDHSDFSVSSTEHRAITYFAPL